MKPKTFEELFSFESVCRILDDATEANYGVRPYQTKKKLPVGWQKDAEIQASNPDDEGDEKYANLSKEDDIYTQVEENN